MGSHDVPVHAIVPVNLLRKAKTRLSRVLLPAEREQLTLAMLSDVLQALHGSPRIAEITVVSTDRKLPNIARRYGAEFMWEGARHGLNRALRKAIAAVGEEEKVMIIHADLPLLVRSDISKFLARSKGYDIGIVPCKENRGTNALLLSRPGVLSPSFGKGSFRRHVSYARKKRLRYKILHILGIQFDIDTPDDLHRFMRRRVSNETGRYLFALLRAKPKEFRVKSRLLQ